MPGPITDAASSPAVQRNGRRIEIASPGALNHLDVVRGVAALTVVVGHLRHLFFANLADLPNRQNPAVALVYFATSLGRQAVIVFFVLSGFFISWAVISAMRAHRWSWRGYFARRLTRLGIVLLPALLLTVFWDVAGIGLFGAQSAYLGGRPGDSVLTFRVVDYLTPQTFFANTLFLQGIHGIPTFGSNAPLWSLSYEFWYYMLFPLMLSAYLAHGLVRLFCLAAIAVILILVGQTIAAYYLIWLLGVVIVLGSLRLGRRRELLPGWVLIPAGLLLALGLAVGQRNLLHFGDAFLGVTSAVFLTVIVLQRGSAARNSRSGHLYAAVARRLAGCSYTLYLVHLPVLIFLRAAFNPTVPWMPDLLHIAFGVVIFTAVLVYALIVAWFTEARTDELRTLVIRRFPVLA